MTDFLTVDPNTLDRQSLIAVVNDLQNRLEDVHAVSEDFTWKAVRFLKAPMGEAKILRALASGRRLTRDGLLALVHGGDLSGAPSFETVNVQICRLRKRLKPLGIRIDTVWGEGYYLSKLDIAHLMDWLDQQAALSA